MKIRALITLIVSVLLIFALTARLDVSVVKSLWGAASWHFVVLGLLFLLIAQVCAGIRWHLILTALRHGIGLRRALLMYAANLPISRVFPAFSGDFTKAYYLRREHDVMRNIGGVIVEPYLDMAVLSILVVIGGAFVSLTAFLGGLFLLAVVALLGFFLFRGSAGMLPRSWRERFLRSVAAVKDVLGSPGVALRLTALTLISWGLSFLCVFLFFRAFGSSVPWEAVLLIQPVVVLVTLLPVAIGGIGSREASMIVLYGAYASSVAAFSVGLLFSVVNSVVIPLCCVPLTMRQLRDSIVEQ